jgi:hypothetical protein
LCWWRDWRRRRRSFAPRDALAAEEKGVKTVEALGGRVWRDDKRLGRPVVGASISNRPVTDADLAGLKGLKSLRDLELYGTQISDVGLKELTELKELESLGLGHTKVTEAGLKELRQALPEATIFPLPDARDRG